MTLNKGNTYYLTKKEITNFKRISKYLFEAGLDLKGVVLNEILTLQPLFAWDQRTGQTYPIEAVHFDGESIQLKFTTGLKD